MSFDSFWHGSLQRPYKLHAVSHGDFDKPVVILLHGIAASGEAWGTLVPLLTPQYRCITIDLLGFGKSPKPQWAAYDIDQHVRSIHRTVRSLHIRGDYILVGHSLGSLLATTYARRYPSHIRRMLLLSPPVYPPLSTIAGKLALKRTDLLMRVYRILRESARITPTSLNRLGRLGVVPRSVSTHPETWLPFKRSLERCIEQQTIEADIKDVDIPIDIIYGKLDTVVIGENVRALARLRDVEVRTFRGNHTLGRTYARTVAKLLMSHSVNSTTPS